MKSRRCRFRARVRACSPLQVHVNSGKDVLAFEAATYRLVAHSDNLPRLIEYISTYILTMDFEWDEAKSRGNVDEFIHQQAP